jgi:peptidoglycan/xylan/chitin deacetylase (PgdA/CDA1 family)
MRELVMDALSTSQHAAVNNLELIGELSIGTIPTTNPAELDDQELAIDSMGTIPTTNPVTLNDRELTTESMGMLPITPMPEVNNPWLSGVLATNAIPTTPIPAVSNAELVIEPEIDGFPTIKLPIVNEQRKRQRPPALAVGMASLLLCALIVGIYLLASTDLLSYISAALLARGTSQQAHARSQQATPIAAMATPTVAAANDASEVTALGQQYMHALFNQQYDVMWSLLHPQVQAMWPSESSFSAYWHTHFQGFTLQQFMLGQVHSLSFWVNPETMVRYNQVEVLPISLRLSAQVPANKISQLPILDQNPSQLFQNLPLIAQRTVTQTGRETVDQWLILSGGPADLEAPILPPVMPVNRTINLPILMYHHITNIPTHDLLDLSLTVAPTVFSQQLDYLKQHGYHTITYNQLFDFLYYGGPLPSKPIILTFDDGYADAYQFAYPILQAHDYSGMFFIITGKVGWKGQATWNEWREMLANGMQMGSHTITHRNMGAVWLFSHAEAQQELQQSKQTLQTQLGILIQQFCYPSGEPFRTGKPYVQQAIMALLAQDGYTGATTDPPPIGITQNSQKPFILLRVRVDGRESLQAFYESLP